MTDPTPAELDQAVIDAGKALAVARQQQPQDPDVIARLRQQLLDARIARGYENA